ncbi:MAG: sodium-translocating pyrophosphatase [Thermoanaerobaculia bacterium]|nr:K(+)-stimulated pyrophosphate-energized sodium pump [Thermoanaerobaculia bacterium]MCK6681736.1 sodium-translocating pyrophosphatase [Thermoanaerobaculia bacterium]
MPPSAQVLLPLILGISALALGVAVYLTKWVLAKETGTPEMRKISDAIKEGAEAFLSRQNRTISLLAVVLAVVIFALYAFVRSHHEFDPVDSTMAMAFWITLSFAFGAICSVIAGYIGMWVSIRTNIRTASAARSSLNDALRIALRGGAVSGLFVVAMSLLGVGGLYAIVDLMTNVKEDKIPLLIVGYGFGASFVALFAQLGGGIYTKAADVGADLVGKVEAGIPEDDPRNPAVIADLVGDNVGDCAGRGADLFESTAAENIGAMILGAALAMTAEKAGMAFSAGVVGVMLFPLVARALGIIAAIVGIFAVKLTNEDEDPMKALNRGYAWTAILAIAAFGLTTYWLLQNTARPNAWWMFFICGIIGVLTSWAFVWITQYYTEYRYRPVREIAEASVTGPATNIISGLAIGMECTMLPVITISVAILSSYKIGEAAVVHGGLFGTAVATMGMLGTAAYVLAMDTFGPITDNAGGIVEMSGQPENVRKKTDRLDSVGNTTKALTKGYAIGSAALAAFLLFSAYMDEVRLYLGDEKAFRSVDIAKPEIFVGGLLGAMLVFFFSALAIKAVGRAAQSVIADVRAQFKEKPGIMEGTDKPDYARCVDIVTRGALRQMVLPGIVAVGTPIAVGLVFRLFIIPTDKTIAAEAVAALLMVGTIAGILMATFLNNGGGAWDNAKKYIESGEFKVDGRVVGKRSEPHKAAVVGDTVGDPFKDTAGPSLHVLIKLLSTITLVLAPLFL